MHVKHKWKKTERNFKETHSQQISTIQDKKRLGF